MALRFFRRRAHRRRLTHGKVVDVRECWVPQYENEESNNSSYRHPCPCCGAEIISVHLPNGGWAHFEGGRGLGRVKHPCMHVGEKMGSGSDNLTLDLFQTENDYDDL